MMFFSFIFWALLVSEVGRRNSSPGRKENKEKTQYDLILEDGTATLFSQEFDL